MRLCTFKTWGPPKSGLRLLHLGIYNFVENRMLLRWSVWHLPFLVARFTRNLATEILGLTPKFATSSGQHIYTYM